MVCVARGSGLAGGRSSSLSITRCFAGAFLTSEGLQGSATAANQLGCAFALSATSLIASGNSFNETIPPLGAYKAKRLPCS